VPCHPNARQVRRPRRYAQAYPANDNPANNTGAPPRKIALVATAADSQLAGDAVNANFTLSTMPATAHRHNSHSKLAPLTKAPPLRYSPNRGHQTIWISVQKLQTQCAPILGYPILTPTSSGKKSPLTNNRLGRSESSACDSRSSHRLEVLLLQAMAQATASQPDGVSEPHRSAAPQHSRPALGGDAGPCPRRWPQRGNLHAPHGRHLTKNFLPLSTALLWSDVWIENAEPECAKMNRHCCSS
jgi:hypothetical protein